MGTRASRRFNWGPTIGLLVLAAAIVIGGLVWQAYYTPPAPTAPDPKLQAQMKQFQAMAHEVQLQKKETEDALRDARGPAKTAH